MSMLGKGIIERALEAIDMEKMTHEFMSSFTLKGMEMYFVVRQLPDSDHYDFVGLAYSKSAAGKLWIEANRDGKAKVLELNLGKALTLAEEAGIVSVAPETE